ncbi:hypothetical protein, partial [Edwardsiella tarda]|uniref:hypothetical protein n=1 Tax=Edwardsiella tarda TaxID=636 RepID=UPI001C9CB102
VEAVLQQSMTIHLTIFIAKDNNRVKITVWPDTHVPASMPQPCEASSGQVAANTNKGRAIA